MTATDDYLLRRPRPEDRPGLAGLAADIWGADRDDHFTDRWWWRDEEPHCWIAEQRSTGAIAAVCAQRRSRALIGGAVVPATTVSDWYVGRAHAGAGLGRRLVRQGQVDDGLMYTSAISDSAATGFARLGWTGDRRVPMFVGPVPLVRALTTPRGQDRSVTVSHRSLSPSSPGDLEAVDRIWSDLAWPAPAMMVRDGGHLRAHLALAGDRGYQLFVATRDGVPVGYLVTRVLPGGSIRALGPVRVGIVSDYLVGYRDTPALRALMGQAASHWTGLGVRVATILAAAPPHCSRLTRWGFGRPVSVAGRTVGARLSSRTMYAPRPGVDGSWHLTYADNDTDLILGAGTPAGVP